MSRQLPPLSYTGLAGQLGIGPSSMLDKHRHLQMPPFGMRLERMKGFEPSTSTLARLHSTPELHPHLVFYFVVYRFLVFRLGGSSNP
jgi:hypothetical protein